MASNMPKSTRLYGKFMTEVINDQKLGEELLMRARNLQNASQNLRRIHLFTSNEDV